MLITGGTCFGLCNIRWKISQLFSPLFLEILCMRSYAACLWWLYELNIYMEITHVQWLWKPSDMLTERCQKDVRVQCKNCNILQKMKGVLRLKVVGTEEVIISLPKPATFWKNAKQPLWWRGIQALWLSNREFSLGQTQRPDCHLLPSKAYSEPEIK